MVFMGFGQVVGKPDAKYAAGRAKNLYHKGTCLGKLRYETLRTCTSYVLQPFSTGT